MRVSSSDIINWVKALLSGGSLTLTLLFGIGIKCHLMQIFHHLCPGASLSLISGWVETLRIGETLWAACGLLLMGTTWLAAQGRESSLAVIQRIIMAFVTFVILASVIPFNSAPSGLYVGPMPDTKIPITDYLCLIPCSVPLLIALIKHIRRKRTLTSA